MPQPLPQELYRAAQARELDRLAIEVHGIPGAVLMERAGAAAYRLARERWPGARRVTLVCGVGNNGGDGYVLARLARADGLAARVLQLGDLDRLKGDALAMARRYREAGGAWEPFQGLPADTEVIVDAVLGTGLEREVTGPWAAALKAMNRHPAPILAIDIPSGLHADSGRILGCAARAAVTISFIGLKQGLFTGQGPDCRGDTYFDGLGVPAAVYGRQPPGAWRIDWRDLSARLGPRPRGAHKGDFGHVLVVGGAPGFSGAARMAGEAALRAGAGLVSLATDPRHAGLLNLTRPELMCHGVVGAHELDPLLARANVVAIGPGLGLGAWGHALLARVLETELPLVMDADALNLLARHPARRENWVLTPHPGEAARLLDAPVVQVQADRFAAARQLAERFGGTLVLKGAGTLIQGPDGKAPSVCTDGNPGMASGGMGDLLTGIIAALIAQGWDPESAARLGVALHGAAGDRAARDGERGLLAGDLLPEVRRLVNPERAPA